MEEIIKLQARLQYLFPNHIYYYFYRFKPEKISDGFGMCPKYLLSEVENRRGLDQDKNFDRSLAHSRKNNNFLEIAEEFSIIKLLPWSKKLEWFVKNFAKENDYKNLDIIGNAMLSDLCEELEIYSKNNWSGLMNKKLLKQRMMILSNFVKNEHIITIFSNPAAKKVYIRIVINYIYAARKIDSFRDYLWFNRNKRIVLSMCEETIKQFIEKNMREEGINIENQVNALNNKNENIQIIFDYSIRPFKHKVVFHQEIHDNVRIVDIDNFPPQQKFDFPHIKIDQNKFFDPITGFYNKEARSAVLKDGSNKCYFDLSEMWNENINGPIIGVKEYSKKTLIAKAQE